MKRLRERDGKPKRGRRGRPARTRWLNPTIVGFALTSLWSDMSHEMATALMPGFLAALGAPPVALGIVEGVSDWAASALKLWGGRAADRLPRRKPAVLVGYLATALKGFFFLAHAWATVLVLRTVAWMGRGARGPIRDTMMTESLAPGDYGKGFGFQRAMDTLGAVIGPLLAYLLLPRSGYRTTFVWTLVPAALAVLTVAALVRERPRETRTPARWREAIRGLPRRFRFFLLGVGIFGAGNFAPTLQILRATQVLTPAYGSVAAGATAILLYTLHNALYALGAYPAGWLGDRYSKVRLLVAGQLLFVAAAAGFVRIHAVVGFLLLFVLSGLSAAVVDAVEGSLAAELLPVVIRGSGFGVLATVNGIGDMVASILVGWIWTALSAEAAFGCAAAVALAGAAILATTRGAPD